MNSQDKKIAEKAVRSMIADLKEQDVFSSFEDVKKYVKKQFKEQTAVAKSYLKSAIQAS